MQSVHQVAGLGVGWVRVFAAWNIFEPNRGHLNEPEIATLEEGLAALPKGTKVIVDVVNTPQWETGSSNPAMPPSNPADYARFAGALAKRFAGRVAAWEIWNEEDASLWWASGPDPAAYTALLKAAYPAIKSAEPSATVVLGGLTGNDYEFLSQLYADGAKGFFDAVAVHTDTICDVESPYEILRNGQTDPRISRWSFLGYRTVHEVMLAHGDGSPIWMTELGWSTDTSVCNSGAWAGQKPAGVSPQQQATFLLQAYHCLAQDSYVQVGIWFGLQDTEPFGSPRSSYGSARPEPAAQAGLRGAGRIRPQRGSPQRTVRRPTGPDGQADEPEDRGALQQHPADLGDRQRQREGLPNLAVRRRSHHPQLLRPRWHDHAERAHGLVRRAPAQARQAHADRQGFRRAQQHEHDVDHDRSHRQAQKAQAPSAQTLSARR